MSNIQQNLALIKSAVYGEEVRDAIHDAIHDCYEDGKAGDIDLVAREEIADVNNTLSNRISNIIAQSGTSDTEVVDARVDANSNTYMTLKDRLDTENADLKSATSILGIPLCETISGTKTVTINRHIPAGIYKLFISSIISSDNDSTLSAVTFRNASNGVITYFLLDRNTTINMSLELDSDCEAIQFNASDTNAHSTGDTFTFNAFSIIQYDYNDTIEKIDSTFNNFGVYFCKSVSGIKSVNIDADIPAGLYRIKIKSITSSDTDSTLSTIIFKRSNNSAFTYYSFNRNTPIDFYVVLNEACKRIQFIASDTNAHSTGDTFTFNTCTIIKFDSNMDKSENIDVFANELYDNKSLCLAGNFKGTTFIPIDKELTPGYYNLKISDIQSSDTDHTKSTIAFKNSNNAIITYKLLSRNTSVDITIELPNTCSKIELYASDTSIDSSNDIFEYNGLSISKVYTDKSAQELALSGNVKTIIGTISGTINATTQLSLQKGLYILSIDKITSSDTDDETSGLVFNDSNNSIITHFEFERNTPIEVVVYLGKDCHSMRVAAANTSAASTDDTFEFKNVTMTYIVQNNPRLKIAVFGDSIMGQDGQIVNNLNAFFDHGIVYNCAIGGTGVSDIASPSNYLHYFEGINLITAITTENWDDQDRESANFNENYIEHYRNIRYMDYNNLDLIIFAWGTNDYSTHNGLSKIQNAYAEIFGMLRRKYPKLRILVFTPIWRLMGYDSSTGTYLESDTMQNRSGVTLRQIANGIIEVCKEYHVSVYDTYSNMGLSLDNFTTFFDANDGENSIEFPPDSGKRYSGVHLNKEANIVYSQIMHGVINSIF